MASTCQVLFFMLIGLYVVLWAKAKDLKKIKQEAVPKLLHESL